MPAGRLRSDPEGGARLGARARMTGLAVTEVGTSRTQEEVLDLLGMKGDPFAERVFGRCGVRRRNLGLTEAMLDSSLQGRTTLTEDLLYEQAVQAVDQLGVHPAEVGTVVTSSLFSLGGPTLAHRLVEHYAMDPATDKYHVLGVGCASAVPLFRLATTALAEHPGKRGLVVAADSMSGLMTRAAPGDPRAKIVGSSIWGDGCGAAVIEVGEGRPGPVIAASTVHHLGRTLDHVSMELSDGDSYLHLNRDLPDVAAAGLAGLVADFLEPHGLTPFAIDHWIVHPGGRRIVECIQEALALSDAQLEISYDVLANRGNVGTPSIFYVLHETQARRAPAAGHLGLLVTVGPGITVGLMLLAW